MKPKKKKNIAKKLIHHYKFVMMDQDEHKEKFSIKLNAINVLLLFALFSLLVIGATVLLLLYSPAKNYLVSQPESIEETQYKKQLLSLNERINGLEDSLVSNQIYIKEIQKVVSGKIKAADIDTSLVANQYALSLDNELLKPTAEDSIFRQEIAKEEMEALNQKQNNSKNNLLFTPLSGIVTAGYDIKENHLAIDVAAKEGDPVKSVADGVVVFSGWTPDTGYVVMISHPNEVLSVYKHNLKSYKKVGESVSKGEAIAAVGNTGELTSGPHLHFELWIKGNAVDPATYIDF